jgi:sugar/nucleoside kinase (ribokinase family)
VTDVPSRVVVVGVASLYMSVGVPGFPVEHEPATRPAWLHSGVTGAAAHIAKILTTLGDEVRLCTLVGVDPAGLAIRADLSAAGLSGEGIIDAGATSLGVVLVSPDGSRMGYPYMAAVNAVGYPAGVFRHLARGASLAVLTNTRFASPLIRDARQLSVPVAVDVHLIADVEDAYNRPWLEAADIVFCSHERLPCPPEEWVGRVFARYPGCQVVGIGRGSDGAMLGLRDGTLVWASAVAPRGVVSTAGAGDALFASFLHGWLVTSNPVEALSAAVLHAGWKVGSPLPGGSCLDKVELARLGAECQVRTRVGRWTEGKAH